MSSSSSIIVTPIVRNFIFLSLLMNLIKVVTVITWEKDINIKINKKIGIEKITLNIILLMVQLFAVFMNIHKYRQRIINSHDAPLSMFNLFVK